MISLMRGLQHVLREALPAIELWVSTGISHPVEIALVWMSETGSQCILDPHLCKIELIDYKPCKGGKSLILKCKCRNLALSTKNLSSAILHLESMGFIKRLTKLLVCSVVSTIIKDRIIVLTHVFIFA
jgi:hypothetical protein